MSLGHEPADTTGGLPRSPMKTLGPSTGFEARAASALSAIAARGTTRPLNNTRKSSSTAECERALRATMVIAGVIDTRDTSV